MKKVLITGATGNIGRAVIRHFHGSHNYQIIAGVRDETRAKARLVNYPELSFTRFQSPPRITNHYRTLCGQEPTGLRAFLEREKTRFLKFNS